MLVVKHSLSHRFAVMVAFEDAHRFPDQPAAGRNTPTGESA
jgi:hypothetical protein